MARPLTLEQLKEKRDQIKTEIATKTGERTAELNALKKDYGVKDLDDAYALLKKIGKQVENAEQDRSSLLQQATTKLEEYGYV